MKKFLSKFWPVLFILVVWLFFAAPFFLHNKVPYSSTFQVNHFTPWSSYQQFAGPVKNGAMPDVTSQIYPWKHFTIQTLEQRILPLWNPYSFSGTPQLANYQSAVLSPFNVLFFILSFINAWSFLVLFQPLLAGLFSYLFARSLKISKEGSLLSSLSFMFCGFIVVWMDYATLGYAILFLPLALYAIESFYSTNKRRYPILLSITFPLSFFSGHFQISLYFALFICAYILFKFLTAKEKKKTIALLFYLFFGVLLTAPQVFPSIEQYGQTLRSTLFQKGEAIPFGYLPTLLSPDFFGNPVTRNDWFGHYAEWNGYLGLVSLLLGIFAVIKKRTALVWFLIIASLVALLAAFDSPLLNLIVALHVPVLATSAASRIIVLFSFSFSILAGIGFDEFIKVGESAKKNIYKTFLLFAVFFMALWGIVFLKLFLPLDKIAIAKSNLYLPSAIMIAVFIILFDLIHAKKKVIPIAALLLLTSFDMLRFATKWQPFDPKNLVFPDITITNFFPKISNEYRVIGQFGAEDAVYYHLPSVEGYDAVYQQRYGEFIASLSNGKIQESPRSVVEFPKSGKYTPQAINLLGIKYVVHKVTDGHAPWTFPFWTYPTDQFKQIYKDDLFEVYENQKVYPRAFLAGNYKVEQSSQSIIGAMFDASTNLKNTVVLEEKPNIVESHINGSTTITKYSPNDILITAQTNNPALLFLSDTYYPGWKAFVNGQPAHILRADYDFRAVVVSKGKSKVEFKYDPMSLWMGIYAFALGILGLIVMSLKKLFL